MAIIKTNPVPPGADWDWTEAYCSVPLEPETEYEAHLDYPAEDGIPACYIVYGDRSVPYDWTAVWISDDPNESYGATLIKE